MNSETLKPTTYLRESTTNPPSTEGYETRIDAFRSNPGGFLGFNLAVVPNTILNYHGTTTSSISGKPYLFKEETYYHSEETFDQRLTWKIPKLHDIILIPHFDWINSTNATYILSNGKQTVTVSKPYFEYNVTIEYYEL